MSLFCQGSCGNLHIADRNVDVHRDVEPGPAHPDLFVGLAEDLVILLDKGKHLHLPAPYAEDALAPVISAKTIWFHYGKHHKTYVDN